MISLVFQLLEPGLVFVNHAFLHGLILLVNLKRLLLVNRQRLELSLDLVRDRHHIIRVEELVPQQQLLVLATDGALAASVKTSTFGTGAPQIYKPTRVHHDLHLFLDHGVLHAVIEGLSSSLLDVQNLRDHLGHLLIVDLLLVQLGVALYIGENGVANRVHIAQQPGDEFVVYDGLGEQLGTLVHDQVVAQIE